MLTYLKRLDAYGLTDPDNNEGHPEDRCNVCERPIQDHYPTYSRTRVPARWPHRRAVVIGRLVGRLP